MSYYLKISVIVPCYNQAHFMDACITSLLQQTYSNWECILVNDGSLDHTEEKALEWEKKDARIKYVKKENGGLSSARNYGMKHASGDYIQFLDCDDFLEKAKFSKSIEVINLNEEAIIITNFNEFDEALQKTLPPYCLIKEEYFNQESILKDWDKKFTIPIHCALFPAKLAKKYTFNEVLKAKEDWVFWLQIYENNPKTVFIDEQLVTYRVSSSGMTRNHDFMHKNQLLAFNILENLILDKSLYYSFLKYNNEFYINQNFELMKKISLLNEKRKLKYKINKVLSLIKIRNKNY